MILIVEDCVDISAALGRLLERRGCGVTRVPSAEEGLAFLQDHRPDVVILDNNLPGQTGVEMQRRMRQDGDLRDIPVLFFSVENAGTSCAAANADGTVQWLRKDDYGWRTVVDTALSSFRNPV